jgi:hypothetical protein
MVSRPFLCVALIDPSKALGVCSRRENDVVLHNNSNMQTILQNYGMTPEDCLPKDLVQRALHA